MKKWTGWLLILTVVLGTALTSPPPSGAAEAGAGDAPLPGYSWVEGVITRVLPPSAEQPYQALELEDYYGGRATYQITQFAFITIDELTSRYEALRPGMEAYLYQRDGLVSRIDSFSTTVSGYVEPESRMVQGRIIHIERSEIQLALATGQQPTYYLTGATIVQRKGQWVPVDTLYAGDKVKLYFDQAVSPEVSRIEAEGNSVIVSDVSKGILQSVNRVSNRMVLKNTSTLGSGVWRTGAATPVSLDWSSDTPIYAGTQKITASQLQYYQGRTVYWAIQNALGKDRIARMVVQSGYESTYQGQIQDVGIAHDVLKLNNNKNIALHEGSIVIRDGRLQEVTALSPGMDVYVVADGALPNVVAQVVYVLNAGVNANNLGQYRVYAGPMDMLLDQSVRLNRFFMLEDNEWINYSDAKELYYDNETKIFDAALNRVIPNEDFIRGSYYVDHYVYAYTMGDRCIGIWVDRRLRLPRTISAVTVGSIRNSLPNDRDMTLALAEERLWLTDEWTFTYPTDKHFLENAMIIRDDKVVSVADIRPGDRLYMVCNDNVPRIVIIK